MGLNQDDPLVRLATMVREMRALQRKFFAGDKSSATFDRAKTLERAVDREVSAVLDVRQGELFAGPTGSGPYGRER